MNNDYTLKVAGIINDSVVDGPGLRLAIFTQGCPHLCDGCHNPQSHADNGGYVTSIADIISIIQKNPLLDGVTFTGGEPLLQHESLSVLACEIKKMGLNLIIYTGYKWEEIMEQYEKYKELLSYTDILIDGPFIKELQSYELKYKGSRNQRVIDVLRSLHDKSPKEIEI